MEYRTYKPAKFNLLIDAGEHPTFLLQQAAHLPGLPSLQVLLEDNTEFLDEAYERVWIEAYRGHGIVGYAVLDLYRTLDLAYFHHGTNLLQINADMENIKAGVFGAIREIEVISYDHEALIGMKKAIDVLLWKNAVELGK